MKRVQDLVETVGAMLLATIVIIVLIQIVGRYVLRIALTWPEELARYVLVWLVFVGAAAAAGRHQHIVVDTLTELLPKRARLPAQGFATVAGLIAIGVLVWVSQPLFGPASRSTSPATGIPSFWIYLALPVGGALLGMFALADLWRVLRGRPLETSNEALGVTAKEDRG
ncbi:MAG: TRAP transporter small permease [Chloroflexi bacterium]|nr:TRAP transporter small permease [Chloroflexota bacterium]